MTPTHQFLASVAAADAPIPSIEEPIVVDEDMDDHMSSSAAFDNVPSSDAGLSIRAFSPPKTPAPPGAEAAPTPSPFPDWSLDPSLNESDFESSRPSTAHSARTSGSSWSQLSFTTDGLSQHDNDFPEPSNSYDTKDLDSSLLAPPDSDMTIRAPSHTHMSRKSRWAQAMSRHLWSTYTRYLEDPRVTPIRISACGVPPCGVVDRVARQARKTWRGPNPQVQDRSGSTTPVADKSSTYMQWPHTNAATRAHLIEMCKANAGGKGRNERYFRSPTPFGKTISRSRARRMTPARSPSVFSGNDMAMSLALSTSESMQPGAPLAQLTRSGAHGPSSLSASTSAPGLTEELEQQEQPQTQEQEQEQEQGQRRRLSSPPRMATLPRLSDESRPRLGSPFVAHSYGPSSSASLANALDINAEPPQRQSHTLGNRRSLKSPARMGRSRSNTLNKRRPRQQQHNMELRRTKRPSLPSDMWSEPPASPIEPAASSDMMQSPTGARTTGTAAAVAALTNDDIRRSRPRHRPHLSLDYHPSHPVDPAPPFGLSAASISSLAAPAFAADNDAPARLGSPFGGLPSSFSFPLRRGAALPSEDAATTGLFGNSEGPRPFASVREQPLSTGRDRDSRMAYLNEQLNLIRQRGEERRRFGSPL